MITLASDFGEPYPAAMRGVVARRTDARIVDVTHQLPRQDVGAAAFWLRELLPYFPPATHCVVVDPGVGTDRRAIALRVGQHVLVGPDNGVLDPVGRRLSGSPPPAGSGLSGTTDSKDTDGRDDQSGDTDGRDDQSGDTDRRGDPPFRAYEILVDEPESSTFHGRDVFAPAAAAVHEIGAESMTDLPFLEPIDAVESYRFPEPERYECGAVGTVLVVDEFGNAITNLPGELLDGRETVRVNDDPVPVGRSFAAVPEGQWLVTVGSHGNVELAVNRGRGDVAFDVAPGDSIWIEFG